MSQRSQAATSQQKPVDGGGAGEKSVLRSAYEYNTAAAGANVEVKKGSVMLGGPVNKADQQSRASVMKQSASIVSFSTLFCLDFKFLLNISFFRPQRRAQSKRIPQTENCSLCVMVNVWIECFQVGCSWVGPKVADTNRTT